MKPAAVRLYFDADIRGEGKLLAQVRTDVTYPGDPGGELHKRQRPPCPITNPRTPDSVWIPEVARRGWLIITRDSQIQQNSAEIGMVLDHSATMVALSGKDAVNNFAQLEVLMTQWRKIDELVGLPGPFIYTATRTSLRKLDLYA